MQRLWPFLAVVVVLLAAACGPTRQWVPVEVDWTFGGQPCDKAGVATIQIDIAGEVLSPNQFTCAEAGTGASLGQFLPGNYTTTVTGLDSGGNVVYQSTQVLQVRNIPRNVFPFDAAPTTGTVTVQWTFAGKSCDAAGVTTVRVSVDNQVITDAQNNPNLPCKSATIEGTTIGPLAAGSHTFALAAQSSTSGTNYEASDLSPVVTAGQDTLLAADLRTATPTTASADVRWTFGNGLSCQQAGVDHIWVYFDPPASGGWGKSIADTPCTGIGGAVVTELNIVDIPDGQHTFAIQGTQNSVLRYYTHSPKATLFQAPFTTIVDVTAESTP